MALKRVNWLLAIAGAQSVSSRRRAHRDGWGGGSRLSKAPRGFPAARRVLPTLRGGPKGWKVDSTARQSLPLKWVIYVLWKQGNESFVHLRPSVLLRRGPLAAREAGQASLGRTLSQEEMGQNRGHPSLPCGSPGKAAFQPMQPKFSGHESDPYVPFPPLRRVQMLQIPTCTYTHARARAPTHRRTRARTHAHVRRACLSFPGVFNFLGC